MAKIPAKKAAPAAKAAPIKTAAPKVSTSTYQSIEDACQASLDKLRQLNLDYQLQSEIDWCLASYRNDGNPVGLYQMVERAIGVFKEEQAKKTKGVTAKLISDLQKLVDARG